MSIKKHLIDRGMDVSLYRPIYSNRGKVVSFLTYNLAGQITGFQQYRPSGSKKDNNHPRSGKYYTRGGEYHQPVWGFEVSYDDPRLFVVEGLFKAAVLHRLGYNAIAVFTNAPKGLKGLFRVLGKSKRLIAIGDNDPAGEKLVRVVGYGGCSPVDLDEMDDYSVHEFVKSF